MIIQFQKLIKKLFNRTKLIFNSNFLFYGLIFTLIFIWVTFVKFLTTDEFEHLHFSFLVGNGKIPYVDFFQHHLPLIWYLFSFVSLIPTFFGKIIISRLLISIIWFLTVFLIDKFTQTKNSLLITLSLILVHPYYDYIQIRPEFLLSPLFVYVLYILKSKEAPKLSLWLICLLTFSLYMTPRFYYVLLVLGIYFLNKEKLKKSIEYIMITFAVFIFTLFVFDYQDILFFVFDVTQKSRCVYSVFKNPYFLLLLIPLSWSLIMTFIKKDYYLSVLIILNFITILFEKNPFLDQSTHFLILIFIFVFSSYFRLQKLKYLGVLTIILLIVLKEIVLTNRFQNSGHNQLFSNPAIINNYIKLERLYDENRSYFFENLGNHDSRYSFHPIFINDYSYFSFAQSCMDYYFPRIIEYNENRNRKTQYFKDPQKLKFVDKRNQKSYNIVMKYLINNNSRIRR